MQSGATLLGHSVHQMLIVFPLGLLGTSAVFDGAYLVTGNAGMAYVSFWMIASGLVGGAVAAVFGWADWSKIPRNTRAWSVGLTHGLGNGVVMALYAVSWLLRYNNNAEPTVPALVLAGAGLLLSLVTGWLGGELVDRLGVAVHEGAHLNAPSTLSGRPASEEAR